MSPPLLLLARSRSLPRVAAAAALVTVATALATSALVPVPALRYEGAFRVPLVELVPLCLAVLFSTTVRSPFAAIEAVASRRMTCYRAGLLVGSAAVLSGLAGSPALWGAASDSSLTAVRNALGYFSLALLAARLLGSGLAWVAPTGFAGMVLLFGVVPGGGAAPWAWPLHDASSGRSWGVALGGLLLGVVLVSWVRQSAGEDTEVM